MNNDSVVEVWGTTQGNGFCGYVEKKQSSEGNVWQPMEEDCYTSIANQNHVFDTLIYDCRDTITYRLVEYMCVGAVIDIYVSNEQQFIVGDIEIPDMPRNSLISVDVNNQKLNFSFSSSLAEDAMGYVVCKGNPCIALDTIWDKNTSVYVCNTCDIEQVNELAILSFDSCMNTSLRSEQINNMVLKAQRQDCLRNIDLSWNEYINMPTGLNTYEVHVLSNNSDNILFTTQNTNANVDISSYNGEIDFYVKAIGNNNNFFSNSNRITVNQTGTDTLKYMRWQNASVNFDNKSITLQIELDNSIPVSGYDLYRKEEGGNFELVGEIAYSGESILNMEDYLNTEAYDKIYYYYLQAPDRCGNSFTQSLICTTFKANVEEINTKTNRVSWTSFNLFPVEKYEIYRYEKGDLLPEKIGETVLNVFDDVHGGINSYADKLCYFAVAIERNAIGIPRQANSSQNYIKKETLFYIPNAFDPTEGSSSEIATFKPNISYIKKDSYEFKIYNRWGYTVFSTSDVAEGWNGIYKGQLCPTGVYVYKIKYINSMGKMETKSGTFMLYN